MSKLKLKSRKRKPTLQEWIKDDRNFAKVMRELEPQGLFESYIGPDGKLWARRTDKETFEPPTDEEKLN